MFHTPLLLCDAGDAVEVINRVSVVDGLVFVAAVPSAVTASGNIHIDIDALTVGLCDLKLCSNRNGGDVLHAHLIGIDPEFPCGGKGAYSALACF